MPRAHAQRDETGAQQFVDRTAMALASYGFPRMAARVLMAMMAADEPVLSAAQLAERMQVSPAAISGAVRYLGQMGMLIREPVPGSRRDSYRLPTDGWYEATMTKGSIYEHLIRLTDEGVAALKPDTPAGARVAEMRDFFIFMQEELVNVLERWEAHKKATWASETQ
ncbi:MAG: MarR family transcriptional regulator [Corynebacteriales bacterium]|nr:MarR family transcriptional regulator [Mycobacteriales bacterium]